jgi:transposase
MYVETVPNRNSAPAILLRESRRVGKSVQKTTIANLTHWPENVVDALRRSLAGEKLVSVEELFDIERTEPYGHVESVLATIRRLGLDSMIASERSRQRDLVVAMIASRVLTPCSKLATTRLWRESALAEDLSVQDADVDELYDALDWLLARQKKIQKKLAGRHLAEGAQVLYDLSSSYFEGSKCPLAAHGHDRDGKHGMRIVTYGVMTDRDGRPISVEVYPGNTADPKTVPDQVERLRGEFGLSRVVLVGDRGMLTQTQIENIRQYPGLGWISALRSEGIRKLVEAGDIQLTLFDTRNLAEIASPLYPGERLVVCFNPDLARDRLRTRDELLAATEKNLAKIAAEAARRTRKPMADTEVATKVGKVVGRYKMAKHFLWTIAGGRLEWSRKSDAIDAEAALDGFYVIRTGEPAEDLSAPDAVRDYKNLAQVERAFRTLKSPDLRVRPIRHHTEDHVRAHIFLCLLAYYVEWHMRRALAPLLFDDEELATLRADRDPVAPAQPSASAKRKKTRRLTDDGLEVQSFPTLLAKLAKRTRNTCRTKAGQFAPGKVSYSFERITDLTPLQKRAFELLACTQ